MTDEPDFPTELPPESQSQTPVADPATLSLDKTREAPAPAGDSTVWSELIPPTAAPTQTWDWDTIVKLAIDDERTKLQPQITPDSDRQTLPERPRFQLEGYEILQEIGRGGMGIVYKARRLLLGNLVALKVLPAAFASDGERLERFLNEGKIAAGLDDPRLLPVHHIEWADGVPVLVMPYVDGGDLNKIIRAHRFYFQKGRPSTKYQGVSLAPGKRAYLQKLLPLLDQLVEAVGLMHDAGIIHRDIKPSNCLIDGRGNLRLSDFGLARLKAGTRMTTTRSGMGTPGYMSPEAWSGNEDLDEKADVFSLGVTLYQACTFELPYGPGSLGEDHTAVSAGFAKGVPDLVDLEPLILHAIDPDRSTRYTSEDFRKDWRRVRSGLLPNYRRPNIVKRSIRWLKRRKTPVIAALGALVCVAGAALWPFFFPPQPADPLGPQRVVLDTTTPCREFAFVPLDPNTGELRDASSEITRGRGDGSNEIRVTLRPGTYLVVVEWPIEGFHEIYRIVPTGDDATHGITNLTNYTRRDGRVHLSTVRPPPADILAGLDRSMALIRSSGQSGEPHYDYYLDPHEFSVGDWFDYRQRFGQEPEMPRGMPPLKDAPETPPANAPIYNIEWQEAAHTLEVLGKRLPTLGEYRNAVRGDLGAKGWRHGTWPIGMVDDPQLDKIDTSPTVVGLRSNVGEWTSTWASDEAPPGLTISSSVSAKRVIFGAPPSVVWGNVDPQDRDADLSVRVILPREAHWAEKHERTPFYVGFRGVRSTKPRYLRQ